MEMEIGKSEVFLRLSGQSQQDTPVGSCVSDALSARSTRAQTHPSAAMCTMDYVSRMSSMCRAPLGAASSAVSCNCL